MMYWLWAWKRLCGSYPFGERGADGREVRLAPWLQDNRLFFAIRVKIRRPHYRESLSAS